MNVQKIIWGLEELSDKNLQEELWLGNATGQMSSFVEALSVAYDDSGLALCLDSGRYTDHISTEIAEIAIRLDLLLKQVPQSAPPLDIIEHPAMEEVRLLARELLARLKQ